MMTAEQFAYWLQGYAELNSAPPSAEQWQAIRDHLALVFNKVTPSYGPYAPGQVVPYPRHTPFTTTVTC
jgi:hypothetical protein